MGYYVSATSENFRIKNENKVKAYNAMCALNHVKGIEKHGGSYSGGTQTKSWFSWMSENYDEECKTCEEILEELGFSVEVESDTGDIISLEYDSKIGQQDLFLNAIAPFVENGGSIYWSGEDDEKWLHTFTNGYMYYSEAVQKVIYKKAQLIEPISNKLLGVIEA